MMERRSHKRRMLEERRKNMSELKSQVKELRSIIFNMLNFTNMYVLILDQNMIIKFANNSLAIDLGFEKYDDLLDKCWLEFIKTKEGETISAIHHAIANGTKDWEVYREFQNTINGKKGELNVCWFNSHINTDYNWTFSFGIRKKTTQEVSMDSVREYYQDIISKDRVMINAMRDVIGLRDKIVDSCKPSFVI